MNRLRALWNLVNEPPLNPSRLEVRRSDFLRLLKTYFWAPFWLSLILLVFPGSLAGGINIYVYNWGGKFIADEIAQVQLGAKDASSSIDPAQPGERRLFVSPDQRHRQGFDEQLETPRGRTTSEKMHLLGQLLILLLIVYVVDHVLLYAFQQRTIYVAQKIQYRLRQTLYEKMHELPMIYHDRHSAGSLMTHLFADVSVVSDRGVFLFRSIPRQIMMIVVGMILILRIDVQLSLLVMLAIPAYVVCYHWFHSRLKVVNENLREREGRLVAHIANRVSHFLLVKSYVRETSETIDFLRQSRPIVKDTLASVILNTGFTALCGIISGVSMTVVLWLGIRRVQQGEMTLGQLLMFYASAGTMFQPAAALTDLAGLVHRVQAVAGRIIRVLDEAVSLSEANDPLPLADETPEIRFERVTLKYDNRSSPALEDATFTLPAGKKLCVMGPSGAGKTTLAKLACRLVDPTGGCVKLNGQDMRDFRIADVRRLIGFVPQEPVVFSGTIRDNIRYGSDQADLQKIVTAAQHAQIHEFIVQLPEQYQTLTQERGLTLSGGQKQRVNLARTLLLDARVLVLDDCTSALDADTEAKLIESFQTVLRHKTAMIVSHRISIAMNCDLVLMLEQGRVAEFGTPQELLSRDGPFVRLQREQINKAVFIQLIAPV